MKLTKSEKTSIQKVAKENKLDFIRIFGSYPRTKKTSRDIDLVIGGAPLTLKSFSLLHSAFQKIFKKPVDLIQLRPDLSPRLVIDIAKYSIPIWEKPGVGLKYYADLMDRFMPIAQDELLSYPPELKMESII